MIYYCQHGKIAGTFCEECPNGQAHHDYQPGKTAASAGLPPAGGKTVVRPTSGHRDRDSNGAAGRLAARPDLLKAAEECLDELHDILVRLPLLTDPTAIIDRLESVERDLKYAVGIAKSKST